MERYQSVTHFTPEMAREQSAGPWVHRPDVSVSDKPAKEKGGVKVAKSAGGARTSDA